jgi:predicted RNA-binding protein with PIN domain
MIEEWLVDGYNLLYDLQSRKGGPSRDRLFALLAGFASRERRVLMVLDGIGDDQEFRAVRTASFEIVYSQDVSADTHIEKYLCGHKGRAMLMVVTRDNAVAMMARGSGARVYDTREFMEVLAGVDAERSDTLFKQRVRGHGFNRPFDGKV